MSQRRRPDLNSLVLAALAVARAGRLTQLRERTQRSRAVPPDAALILLLLSAARVPAWRAPVLAGEAVASATELVVSGQKRTLALPALARLGAGTAMLATLRRADRWESA